MPLRCCLLSGGESRRMGRDKALLPHPEGGAWLERTLILLGQLGAPITLLSRHPAHLALARQLAPRLPPITAMAEPPPWEGPLLALHRLMQQHPDQRLLVCPVDMPDLTLTALHRLLAASADDPGAFHLAHDGQRLQPLLGIYPSSKPLRTRLAAAVARGDRSLQRWLEALPCRAIALDPRAIRNVNHPEMDQRSAAPSPPPHTDRPGGSHGVAAMATNATDQLNRPLGVLRLSLTARCNLACPYCLPDGIEPPGVLTLEQRRRLIGAAVAMGVTSLRLTGGEPLLHGGLEELITAVQPLRATHPEGPGLREIALTSNGALLSAERARALRAAGLDRITLSLDGTTGAAVARMAGVGGADAQERERRGAALLARVLAAIEHTRNAGFDPSSGALKLNAVILRGANDDQLLPLVALARERGLELRLIEYMDVGNRNGWRPEAVLSAAEMVERISARWPLEPLGRAAHGTASRWRYSDRDPEAGGAHLAVVASVSAPFCGDCNRLRVTADGIAYTCLFAAPGSGLDLRPWLRPDAPADALGQAIAGLWSRRADRWSENRQESRARGNPQGTVAHVEMACLGG
jgi:cyclic pyranopterin phosphate synthase